MKRVGKAWYSPLSSGLYKLMNALYEGKSAKKRVKATHRGRWQASGDWFSFFTMFWNAFRAKFEKSPCWKLHSNLLTAVVIEMLQGDFFRMLDAQTSIVWQVDEADAIKRREIVEGRLHDLVREFVEKFEDRHFDREWKRKSLNHKDGRKDLADLFLKIREGQSIANHVIFTGKAT